MNDIELLKEINTDAKTGIDGISFCIPKTKDSRFLETLLSQKEEYENIYYRTKKLLVDYNEHVEDTPIFQKAMSWMGIQLNTLSNSSNSKVSEILIQGNDMEIVKGTKLLNNTPNITPQTQNILEDFIKLQQENIEGLKKYL